MGFLKNYTAGSNYLKVYISATSNTKVELSIPLQNYVDSIYIPKDSVRVIQVPNSLGNILEYDSVERKAIRIKSDFPITVAAMNLQAATTDASIVLPTVNIPPAATYIVGNPNSSGFGNEFMLVASEDSTKVMILPASNTSKGHPANVPYTVRLNKGELYQVSGSSMSGSLIKVLSNTKVAVFSGDVCSNFPCGACDHQYEQIMPNYLADTAYYIPPHFGHTNGYTLKIVPIDSNISIKVNNTVYNNLNRLTPIVINVTADSGYYISSTKLFHVFQFMKGPSCNGYITTGYGDPAMLEILSAKYMGQSAMFSTVNSTNLRDHFVSIVVNTSSKNSVYLDRVPLDSSEFKEFPFEPGKSYACIRINLGTHLVECTDGMLAYCYGIGFYESYLYLAGFNLPNFDLNFKDSAIGYDCKNKKITVQFKAIVSKTLKKYTWYFGDNTTGNGTPINHTYDTLGVMTVKLVGEDFSGKKDSVTRKVKIDWPAFDPVRNRIFCGIDTVKFIEPNPFFTNFKWQDSSTNNHFSTWNSQSVWVIATDTTGYCKFEDTGYIGKIEILNSLLIDTIDQCFETNRVHFKETTSVFADQIFHKAWVFPFQTIWDTSEVLMKFPMPGKYKIYYDVYTKQENCKARYPMEIIIHPNPKPYTNQYGDFYCAGTDVLFKDSSQILSGHIDSSKWIFDDSIVIVSDSLRTYKKFQYNPQNGYVTRNFTQISYSDKNCTDTISSAVNIWPSPKVNFSISTPDTIKCLPAARWTYTSTTTAYYDSFTLKWDAGNGQTGTARDMRNIRYTSPGIYKVKLTATSDQFACVDSTNKFVEVLALPKARILVDDSIQCLNSNSFAFRDSSDGKYLKQVWTIDTFGTDTGTTINGISFDTIGKFKVKLEVSNGYASCVDITEQIVEIVPPPLAMFTSNKDTMCFVGNQFQFSNKSTFPNKYSSSEWWFTYDSTTVTDTNYSPPNYIALDTGDQIITLIVKDAENCLDTFVKTLRVESHTKSTLSINDNIQCQDSNNFIFKTIIGPNETRKWKIDNKEVQFGKIDSLSLELNVSGQHTVTVVGLNAAGCNDSTSNTFTVLPALNAGMTINNDTQCFDLQDFVIEDKSVATDDIIQSWTYVIDDTLNIQSPNTGSFSMSLPGRYKALLFIKTQENCVDTSELYFDVLALPDISLEGDEVCLGDTSFLKGYSKGTASIDSWKWYLGDGDSALTQNVNHVYQSEGTYNLTLKAVDVYGCFNQISAASTAIVNPLPVADFNTDVLQSGINQVQLKFIPSIFGYTNYYWTFPNGSGSALDSPSLFITDLFKGETKLLVINKFGCKDSSYKYLYVYPNNFNVYIPNAITLNGDLLNDQFKPVGIGATKKYQMRIYNRWGEEIFFSEDPQKGWDGTYANEPVMQDVYTYYIEFTYIDGKVYRFKGTLTVLR